jgi:hypothetical protein
LLLPLLVLHPLSPSHQRRAAPRFGLLLILLIGVLIGLLSDGRWICKEEPCGGQIYDKEASDKACGQEIEGSARWSMGGVALLCSWEEGKDTVQPLLKGLKVRVKFHNNHRIIDVASKNI